MPPKPPPRLTAAHVSRVHRDVADGGPPPGIAQMGEQDYADLVGRLLDELGDAPLRVFAYGSLIWKPAAEFGPGRPAVLHGYHRSFCLKLVRFRGTPDQPGLMMALDRGGSCRGLVFDVIGDRRAELDKILRRETTNKPPTNMPRLLRVAGPDGPVLALAFVVNRDSWAYAGQHSPQETAHILARACGHWGSGADYLFNTVDHLARCGIRDRNLWLLQALVAQEIETLHGPCG